MVKILCCVSSSGYSPSHVGKDKLMLQSFMFKNPIIVILYPLLVSNVTMPTRASDVIELEIASPLRTFLGVV